jgi:hypothetical protein
MRGQTPPIRRIIFLGLALVILTVNPVPGNRINGSISNLYEPQSPDNGTSLSASVASDYLCADGLPTCSAGLSSDRVTLSAVAPQGGVRDWPVVQVIFVLETTVLDGAYCMTNVSGCKVIPNGSASPAFPTYWGFVGLGDPCSGASGSVGPCNESNLDPFFVTHAGPLALAMQRAHPFTQLSFGLVDYFASNDRFDPYSPLSDEYHVDVGSFVPATQFGAAVNTSLRAHMGKDFVLTDVNNTTNYLHSSVITALFGVLNGVGLDWQSNAHHVVIWLGSTAPRDPAYPVSYCPAFVIQIYCSGLGNNATINSTVGYAPSCEPSYTFTNSIRSPKCVGWVTPSGNGSNLTVADLSRHAEFCTNSLGHRCTIDTIDVYSAADDNQSLFWESWPWGWWGPNSTQRADMLSIIAAGCDLALASAGSWDGPFKASCNGQVGTLRYDPTCCALDNTTAPQGWPSGVGWCYGSSVDWCAYTVNGTPTRNPSLFRAILNASFDPPARPMAVAGAAAPLFAFVPIGNFSIDFSAPFSSSCSSVVFHPINCSSQPDVRVVGGVTFLAWDWSTDSAFNKMYAGDTWTASFSMLDTGPPFQRWVPVNACTAVACVAAGSGTVGGGLFSGAFYVSTANGQTQSTSFPLLQVFVEVARPINPVPSPAPPPTPTPPNQPGVPVSLPAPQPLPTPLPVGSLASISVSLAVQAVALGLVGAGVTRVFVRRPSLMVRNALMVRARGNPSVPSRSLFEHDQGRNGVGRFE